MKKVEFNYKSVNKEQIIEDLMDSPLLRNFFLNHDLTSEFIETHLLDFISYNTEKNHCLNCEGLSQCKQDNEGLEPFIAMTEGRFVKGYKKCAFQKNKLNQANDDTLINAMHLPSSILQASLEDFDFSRGKNRTEIHNKIINFVQRYNRGEKPKGLYLWGQNNVGKTYCLSALSKELMKNKVNVIIAYYPDLVREFKSRVATNTVEQIISKLKQVEVLMLDDIGGEGDSVWVRDEILGPILQYRLQDHKPTFFTSNYSRQQLAQKHFSQFRDRDTVRALRIVTRIKELTKTDTEDFQIEM